MVYPLCDLSYGTDLIHMTDYVDGFSSNLRTLTL
jgi:hypothetical protein